MPGVAGARLVRNGRPAAGPAWMDCQGRLNGGGLDGLISISADAAQIHARRVLQRLIEAETAGPAAAAR